MPNEAEQRDADEGRMVVRSFGVRVRAVREEAREIDFVASTDAVDSYGEVVDQGSWRLERYRSNPIVLFAHRSRELPIGKSVRTEVVNGDLECTIRFASEKANPLAEQVWQLCREDVLRAVSVGFIPSDGRYEMRDGEEVFVLSNCELYEISVTPVPANAEALAKMKAKARDAANQERAAARPEETTMNEKEMQARVTQLETEKKAAEERAASAEKSLADASEKTAKLEKDLAEITAKHDAADARAKAAEDKLVESEVDALVGVKILPAEKAAMLKLALKDHDLFVEQVAARPELKLLSPVVTAEKQAVSTATTIDANGEDLAAIAAKDAESVHFD